VLYARGARERIASFIVLTWQASSVPETDDLGDHALDDDHADSDDRAVDHPAIAGWREWVSLPALDVPWIKAKLDTGARTSAIHTYETEEFERDGTDWVRFDVHPWQKSALDSVHVELPVVDRRVIRSSTGHEEERLVVVTEIEVVGRRLDAELTLTNRDEMGFRMLVGREAMRGALLVDPERSYVGGRPPRAMRRRNRQDETSP